MKALNTLTPPALSRLIPFHLQVPVYRSLTGSLKYIGKALNLIIRPPEIFAGPGASLLLCDAIAGTGIQRILLVTDAMLVKLGLIQPLVDRLSARGLAVTVYDGVLPDPAVEQIEQAVQLQKQHHCQAVLAVGGGSSMDCGKVVAARATNDKAIWDMTGFFKVSKAPLPIYCIPTTAGTGSEASVGAVVSDPANQRKLPVIDHKLVPRMAALEGKLMTGLPRNGTAATGMDAMTHAVEAYIGRIAIPESNQLAEEAVKLISEHLPRVLANGQDVDSRQAMSWAAYRAGLAMNRGGLGYVHGIAHNLGAYYHIPHGWANAMVLPYILDYSKESCIPQLARLAKITGMDKDTQNEDVLADRFIAHMRSLNALCGVPDKIEDLKEKDIPGIARAALKEAHLSYAVPRYMDQKTCEGILRKMMV